MNVESRRWVMDTSTFTHFGRAGHHDLLEALAPGGIVLIPSAVNDEIENGRMEHTGIPSVRETSWAQLTVLRDDEYLTMLELKARMGGMNTQNLGECAVIACAHHRDHIAVLDDRAAIAQAGLKQVQHRDSLWIIVEAYKWVLGEDRFRAGRVIDDLLATDMRLPVDSGENFMTWAYINRLLP